MGDTQAQAHAKKFYGVRLGFVRRRFFLPPYSPRNIKNRSQQAVGHFFVNGHQMPNEI
jgi:hypothetical protein